MCDREIRKPADASPPAFLVIAKLGPDATRLAKYPTNKVRHETNHSHVRCHTDRRRRFRLEAEGDMFAKLRTRLALQRGSPCGWDELFRNGTATGEPCGKTRGTVLSPTARRRRSEG